MKSLDLTFFNNATWSVTMPNGLKLEVKKPSQKLLRVLNEKIKDVDSEKDATVQLQKLTSLTKILLSNNNNDVVIDEEVMDSMTTDMLYAIYFGYQEFVSEVVTNPN